MYSLATQVHPVIPGGEELPSTPFLRERSEPVAILEALDELSA
jgi:hypothetical protein